jgi:hypothetical protein
MKTPETLLILPHAIHRSLLKFMMKFFTTMTNFSGAPTGQAELKAASQPGCR